MGETGLFRLLKMLGPKFAYTVATLVFTGIFGLCGIVLRLELGSINANIEASAAASKAQLQDAVRHFDERQIKTEVILGDHERRITRLEK